MVAPYSFIAPNVTAAMAVERTKRKSLLRMRLYFYAKLELYFSIVLAPTWPSYHVSAIKEYQERKNKRKIHLF